MTTPGGQDRTLTVPRPLTAWEAHTTLEATVALISSLLDEHPLTRSPPSLAKSDLELGIEALHRDGPS